MTINSAQLRDIIIRPTLTALGMLSPSAENLLLGTAAVESQIGKYIKQVNGPAIGIFQMEPRTFEDIWERKISTNVAVRAKVRLLLGYEVRPKAERMASDLMLAALMTRIFYYSIPKELPDKDDIIGLATYWKTYYNTPKGKGTVEGFSDAYTRYVKENTA